MINSEPPILVSGPSPLIPSAKMVGNIRDMKKLVAKIAHRPIQPGCTTLTPTRSTLVTAKTPISTFGRTNFIR